MTYYIITIGCQMNKSDSARVASYLEGYGFREASSRNKADIVILTTCGVRQSAEDRIYGLIPDIRGNNKKAKIILTGCLSERKDVQKRLKDKVDIWLPIVELATLAKKLGLKTKKDDASCVSDYLKIEAKHKSGFSAFVPIGNGCNNFCTYCVVPYARGREKYRDHKDILNEVESLLEKGYKEITLIAQNVNSYISPVDKKINFAKLLKLVNDLEGDFWLRFATSHPKDMSDELIETMGRCDKLCEHLHLPAQAGNNRVIKAMNRHYTIEHYKGLLAKVREIMPNVSITTDIIVGFPGETREEFEDTAKLFVEVKYDMAYIAQFSKRPGTKAYDMDDDVPLEEKKKREEDLMVILRKTALENNKNYLNKKVKILVDNKNKKGEWQGHTSSNKNVKIKGEQTDIKKGDFWEVKIVEVDDFGMVGEV